MNINSQPIVPNSTFYLNLPLLFIPSQAGRLSPTNSFLRRRLLSPRHFFSRVHSCLLSQYSIDFNPGSTSGLSSLTVEYILKQVSLCVSGCLFQSPSLFPSNLCTHPQTYVSQVFVDDDDIGTQCFPIYAPPLLYAYDIFSLIPFVLMMMALAIFPEQLVQCSSDGPAQSYCLGFCRGRLPAQSSKAKFIFLGPLGGLFSFCSLSLVVVLLAHMNTPLPCPLFIVPFSRVGNLTKAGLY